MKLFTTAQLTVILVFIAGTTQAVPFSLDTLTPSPSLTNREFGVIGREPQLFYGRQYEQDLDQRGFLTKLLGGVVNKVAGKVVDKIGGKHKETIKKGIGAVTGFFSMFGA